MKPSTRRMIENMTIRHSVARTLTDYKQGLSRLFSANRRSGRAGRLPPLPVVEGPNAVGLRIGAAPVVSHGLLLEPSTGLSRRRPTAESSDRIFPGRAKGWTGPKFVDGKTVECAWHTHQGPNRRLSRYIKEGFAALCQDCGLTSGQSGEEVRDNRIKC